MPTNSFVPPVPGAPNQRRSPGLLEQITVKQSPEGGLSFGFNLSGGSEQLEEAVTKSETKREKTTAEAGKAVRDAAGTQQQQGKSLQDVVTKFLSEELVKQLGAIAVGAI